MMHQMFSVHTTNIGHFEFAFEEIRSGKSQVVITVITISVHT